jgi:hypothetical protein
MNVDCFLSRLHFDDLKWRNKTNEQRNSLRNVVASLRPFATRMYKALSYVRRSDEN